MERLSAILLVSILLLIFNISCQINSPENYKIEKEMVTDSAMVVSAHPLASSVGVEILKQGGNAYDAVIAVQFALAVVYPRAGNIGGGGFMVIRDADGNSNALDYREKAPKASNRDMYLDSSGNVVEGISTSGHLAAGVPGTVAGMWEAHQEYGSLEWKTLLKPAIKLAKEGFHLTITEANRLNQYKGAFIENSTRSNIFTTQDSFVVGFNLVQKELGESLERISRNGRDGFYRGKTADLIIDEMNRGEGIIEYDDLLNYSPVWRKPIEANYKEFKIISMPPPSSGGIALVQMLKMIENYPLKEYGFHSEKAVHLMVEVEQRAYADRAKYLGDPDFYNVPVDTLLDYKYLKKRMEDYDETFPTPSDSIEAEKFEVMLESFETTHTSIVDSKGNAVSVTTTLNGNFGCKVVVGGGGFFLNNEMDDFSAKPGVPNMFGLIGGDANAIEPGKRMLSSMTPTIIEKDNEWFMVLGSPGGSTIITAVFQTIVNTIEFDMSLYEAVQAGRFHHQWKPEEISVEAGKFPLAIKDSLLKRGYKFEDRERMAVIKAIKRLENGKIVGVGDNRNPDDDVEGY